MRLFFVMLALTVAVWTPVMALEPLHHRDAIDTLLNQVLTKSYSPLSRSSSNRFMVNDTAQPRVVRDDRV